MLAALLAEMKDVRGSGCFESCETEFCRPNFSNRVEAPELWRRVAKYVLWKVQEKWKTRSGVSLSEEHLMKSIYSEV